MREKGSTAGSLHAGHAAQAHNPHAHSGGSNRVGSSGDSL